MEVHVRNQVIAVEPVDARCEWLRDVVVAHVLPNDRSVLRLRESVVIGAPRSPLGLLRLPPLQELAHHVVDELRTVVAVEVLDAKRHERECFLQRRFHAGLDELFHGQNDLPLRHLIDVVDVVDALLPAKISLMHGVHPKETGSARRLRFSAFPDRSLHRNSLLDVQGFFAVTAVLPQIVEAGDGNVPQSLIPPVTQRIFFLENLLHCRSVDPLVQVVRLDQKLDVCLRVGDGKTVTLLRFSHRHSITIRLNVP